MPIIIHRNISFVFSRAEFIEEYEKEDLNEKSILEQVITPRFDFNFSLKALSKLILKKKRVEIKGNDEQYYRFNFLDNDAKDIALELIIFFSHFYLNLKVLDSKSNLQSIKEYLLPHKRLYLIENSNITIKSGKMEYTFYLNEIKEVKGILNNFVIFLEHQLIHFCSDTRLGRFVNVIPCKYNSKAQKYYEINDFNYVYKRNKPSRYKLLKIKSREDYIILIQ